MHIFCGITVKICVFVFGKMILAEKQILKCWLDYRDTFYPSPLFIHWRKRFWSIEATKTFRKCKKITKFERQVKWNMFFVALWYFLKGLSLSFFLAFLQMTLYFFVVIAANFWGDIKILLMTMNQTMNDELFSRVENKIWNSVKTQICHLRWSALFFFKAHSCKYFSKFFVT